MRRFGYSLSIATFLVIGTSPVLAQLISPQVGWEANYGTDISPTSAAATTIP